MTSLWNKITENKGIVSALALAGTLSALYFAYSSYKNSQSQDLQQSNKNKQIDIHAQITKLRNEINLTDPSLEDVKKVLTLLSNYVKQKTMNLSKNMKAQRRKRFPHQIRYSNMGQYLRFSSQGLIKLQQTVMNLQKQQTKLMAQLGLSQAQLAKHAKNLGPFMQELMFDPNITEQGTRRSLQLKTQYLKNHGERLIESLIEVSMGLSMQQKQLIPLFLNVVINDQAFQHQPQLDREEYQMAYQKYKTQMRTQIAQMQQTLMPLLGKLQTAMMGEHAGMMGGPGGYGGYPQQYEDDGYGGMGGMGMNEQMMMQQLEQLRIQDPEMYEKVMAMMQAQMGGQY